MYQAPEGGGEKPLRTSYLKDLSEASTGRGGGGTPRPSRCQGQNVSGHNMSGQYMSARLEHGGGQDAAGRSEERECRRPEGRQRRGCRSCKEGR